MASIAHLQLMQRQRIRQMAAAPPTRVLPPSAHIRSFGERRPAAAGVATTTTTTTTAAVRTELDELRTRLCKLEAERYIRTAKCVIPSLPLFKGVPKTEKNIATLRSDVVLTKNHSYSLAQPDVDGVHGILFQRILLCDPETGEVDDTLYAPIGLSAFAADGAGTALVESGSDGDATDAADDGPTTMEALETHSVYFVRFSF